MFPLHEDTIFNLGLIAVGGSMAVFTAWYGRFISWMYAILLTIALLWPWPIAYVLGLDHYTITAALYLSTFTLLAVSVGTVWGLATRRVSAGTVSLIVALLPALAGAAYLLERQRVPDALCAERALFSIGDLKIKIPREMGAQSAVASGAPEQVWQGSYSDWPGAKPNVRTLCFESDMGRETIKVSHLWFPFRWFRNKHEGDCALNQVPDELASYCDASDQTRLVVVQLYARPDGKPLPTLGQFNSEGVIDALLTKETSGYRCSDLNPVTQTRFCTIWLRLSPVVLSVSTAKLGPAIEGEYPVADAEVMLRTATSRLTPRSIDEPLSSSGLDRTSGDTRSLLGSLR